MSKDTGGPALEVGKRCVHVATNPKAFKAGKWEYETDRREVVLMAVSGKFAMVRRPRCGPYVCSVKELEPK
jgi:hypothetical protein